MRRTGLMMILAGGLLAFQSAQAEALGVGLKAGTQGIGAEVGMGLNDYFVARLGFNTYNRSESRAIDGIDYDLDAGLQSTALLLDWYPFAGIFRVSVGYVSNSTEFDLEATPANSVTIGDTTYAPQDIGKIEGTAKFGSGPYLGIGWGNVPAEGFGVTFDVGAFSMPDPDVSYRVSNPNNQIDQADIDQEAKNIEDDLGEVDYYPVVSLGISYGF